jgi:predicted nuclease with RNAse H fold
MKEDDPMIVNPSLVCGVDLGSSNTLSYIAWLDINSKQIVLDCYIPDPILAPLPASLTTGQAPILIGFDCPQSLPEPPSTVRRADKLANTPTRVLPTSLEQLTGENSKKFVYKELIKLGTTLFWNAYIQQIAAIYGLHGNQSIMSNHITLFETYPRFIIKTLFSLKDREIPSKRKQPFLYITKIWSLITSRGYSCSSVIHPSVDQVDAVLCAIAAERLYLKETNQNHIVGTPCKPDNHSQILREGYIIGS